MLALLARDRRGVPFYLGAMLRLTDLALPLDHEPEALRAALLQRLGVADDAVGRVTVFRRGQDARRRGAVRLVYTLDFEATDEAGLLRRHAADRQIGPAPDMVWRPVRVAGAARRTRPVVVGTGPCGLFAALTLAEMGLRPILLERGRVVRERTRDTWAFWRRSALTPESNVQFGEGGAGTFSDGKLYSGIKDSARLGRRVLEVFVESGAPAEILVVAKPHIGTFRLVTVVERLRARIEALGGEYRFGCRVDDLVIEERRGERRVVGLRLASGEEIAAEQVVLAVGHSARDSFAMLHARGVFMEAKPFSIGVRIEHPQRLIDRARFGEQAGHRLLGAADYKLVHHGPRSVYSFCMCPGGTVVAAASEAGGVVTNGMSQYSRAERNANAGIVVAVTPADYAGSPLAGIDFQRHWERRAFVAGGGDYRAPAQRVGDFLAGRASVELGEVVPSYKPGVAPVDLADCLPGYAVAAIRAALPAFDRRVAGFAMADAVMTGVETRTSAPLRITRDAGLQSLNTRGLFPAGEGAGYAGGILSAAVDGVRVAEALASR